MGRWGGQKRTKARRRKARPEFKYWKWRSSLGQSPQQGVLLLNQSVSRVINGVHRSPPFNCRFCLLHNLYLANFLSTSKFLHVSVFVPAAARGNEFTWRIRG